MRLIMMWASWHESTGEYSEQPRGLVIGSALQREANAMGSFGFRPMSVRFDHAWQRSLFFSFSFSLAAAFETCCSRQSRERAKQRPCMCYASVFRGRIKMLDYGMYQGYTQSKHASFANCCRLQLCAVLQGEINVSGTIPDALCFVF